VAPGWGAWSPGPDAWPVSEVPRNMTHDFAFHLVPQLVASFSKVPLEPFFFFFFFFVGLEFELRASCL
jgi:hypothetical protein